MEDNWGNKLASKKEMVIYFIISIFYTLIWLIDTYQPYFNYDFDVFFFVIIFLFLLYLPEVIIFALNHILTKIRNQAAVKIIKILVHLFSFIYFILIGAIILLFIYIGIELDKYPMQS